MASRDGDQSDSGASAPRIGPRGSSTASSGTARAGLAATRRRPPARRALEAQQRATKTQRRPPARRAPEEAARLPPAEDEAVTG